MTQEGTTKRRGEDQELCYEFRIVRRATLLFLSHSLPSRFPSAKRSPHRTHALFFRFDFLFLFSTSFPALLSSIYVSVSPSASALSTRLAPTASPLMVSASAVSISAFYLLSAVSVLFFTSRLLSLAFLSQRCPAT